MRRADIPPAERAEVYRLIFFAWADGGINWDDEKAMRRYAREMGRQWRCFSRTLAYYKRLCSPDESYRLPIFLLRNLKNNLPDIGPVIDDQTAAETPPNDEQNTTKTPPNDEQNTSEIRVNSEQNPQKPVENVPKSFNCDPVENTCHSHSYSHSQKAEEEGSGADSLPFENFTDPQTWMAEAVSIAMGIPSLPEGEDARPIQDAAAEFIDAGVTPADVRAYEQDYYRRKAAQGSAYPLTLKILREDIRGWARSRRMLEAAKGAEDSSPNRPPLAVAPPEWRRKPQNGGAR